MEQSKPKQNIGNFRRITGRYPFDVINSEQIYSSREDFVYRLPFLIDGFTLNDPNVRTVMYKEEDKNTVLVLFDTPNSLQVGILLPSLDQPVSEETPLYKYVVYNAVTKQYLTVPCESLEYVLHQNIQNNESVPLTIAISKILSLEPDAMKDPDIIHLVFARYIY